MKNTTFDNFLLHARADRALRALIGQKLEKYQLTMMEWLLLGVVAGGPEKGLSMSSVAQTLDVTLPQVTALTNKLLSLKLVRQKTQAKDRRSRHIMTTGKGQTMLEDIDETLGSVFGDWKIDVPAGYLDHYWEVVRWFADNRHPDLAGDQV